MSERSIEANEPGVDVVRLAPGISGQEAAGFEPSQRWNRYPKGKASMKSKKAVTAEEKKEKQRAYQRAYQARKRAAAQGGGASAKPSVAAAPRRARSATPATKTSANEATITLAGKTVRVAVETDGSVSVTVGA